VIISEEIIDKHILHTVAKVCVKDTMNTIASYSIMMVEAASTCMEPISESNYIYIKEQAS